MKRIGIYTLIDGTNYGQRLQNFALQTVLENISSDKIQVDTLGYYKPLDRTYQDTLSLRCRASHLFFELFKLHLSPMSLWNRFWQRTEFYRFNHKYIHLSPWLFKVGEEWEKPDNRWSDYYDGFIAGSDQIWNPEIPTVTPLAFLHFAKKGQRYSYAASICCSKERLENFDWAISGLCNMDEISVREYSSVETVRSIVGRSPTVDLDPALLLSSEQWNQLLKLRKRKSSKAYVFLYQIDVVSNPELEKWTENFAKKNGFKVICVREKAMGPKRWLELLKNANVVVSDSYHAVVFSLLFGISFVISSTRGAMNTRMETLLQHAGLNDRNYINIKEEEIISGIDFREVWNRLEELRGISLKRLSGIVQKIETGNEMCLN